MGAIYFLIPRLFGKKEMYSTQADRVHFWVATIGIVLYITSMWISGVMQGLMWRAVNPDGTLTYSFVESVQATYPYYVIRLMGGLIYLAGMFLMAYNVFRTIFGAKDRRIPRHSRRPAH
jgi:cytochrome c oxidase cbb3-type subunit I